MYSKKKNNNLKKIFFSLILLLVLCFISMYYGDVSSLRSSLMVKKGDIYGVVYQQLSWWDQIFLKLYQKANGLEFKILQPWLYQFSGSYSKTEFVTLINAGPVQDYQRYTVLEGWSIYDIDADLAKKWRIQAWEYLAYVTDHDRIQSYSEQFEFLKLFQDAHKVNLPSLEGFLYPDTYFLDVGKEILPQLVVLQLRNFRDRVWKIYGTDFQTKDVAGLNLYEKLTLATVIEKEERNDLNKPTIAGLFVNRIDQWMRLDADITLCYGLKEPYETCTPKIIVRYLDDVKNLYNTRALKGLPPTPIANPTAKTIEATLHYQSTDFVFYLHDMKGNIYFAKNYEEHNLNKSKHLNN